MTEPVDRIVPVDHIDPIDRIVLTGFMGSGKSSVGRLLADRLGWGFIDLDDVIEARAGRTIAEIFDADGEKAFRDLETACFQEILGNQWVVIASGGGTMTFERNRVLARGLARSVWLDIAFDTIAARLDGTARATRPLFHDLARARRLYEERLEAYALSDDRVEVGEHETADSVAARISKSISREPCDTW